MPTSTYVALATTTLASASASVTFSSIPASYRDLVVVFDGEASSGTFVHMRFNSDSGSNYSMVWMDGNGSTASSTSQTSDKVRVGAVYTTQGSIITQIQDYSATDKHKTTLSRSSAASNLVIAIAGRWANTSAITTIEFSPFGANWAAGSTFSLYGIEA